ncbi:MAG: alanine--tRNA ligase [Bacteroidetes bacterium]|jgi:alanyl-tRNA synthetase|nr:alanine--tRNA ligase [Bacteroidota bacterium]
MTSTEIRQSFFDFFAKHQHAIVPSAPVIPGDDPTLLFTNAGMNQFKDVFLGTGRRPYHRAADTQKCIRVSGKHNDLEEVGRDTYHHTFFEMLGNWSFGDYYKREAIAWAWDLLTKVWGLPKERLWATVYKDDEEAETLWKEVTDIDPSHVLRFGEKDNFWEMGETGPCGPCSEIHIDRTPNGTATASMVNAGVPELMEIWNLVFIQYNRDAAGVLHPLPAKHVDTGMGFERICAVLQGKGSNYDTDVFMPIIRATSELSRKPYDGRMDGSISAEQAEVDVAMRVIADHLRTLTFAIADGAVPSNEGRGYVLRRILRRAARFGRTLGLREPFIHRLVPTLTATMGGVFPEIVQKETHVERVIHGEEESFNATLDRGLEVFEQISGRLRATGGLRISGEDAFRLYDTFGFPIDLTSLMALERGLTVDEEGFKESLERQKERSRDAHKGAGTSLAVKFAADPARSAETRFLGYTSLEAEARVMSADDAFVLLDQTPFYGESGGQVGDSGVLEFGGTSVRIVETQKDGKVFGHRYEGVAKDLIGKTVRVRVDAERRAAIERNHSATHLVHEALRRVLGEHLHQQGSLVAESHLRFDFNHFERVSPEDLRTIEEMVNDKIGQGIPVHTLNDPSEWLTIEEAKRRWPNVKMFFGEKYGERVRVVEIDPTYSVELCGGTHVVNTRAIGHFRFRSEGSVASGIRRIDAVTGDGAVALLRLRDQELSQRIEATAEAVDGLSGMLREVESVSGVTSPIGSRDLQGMIDRLEQVRRAIQAGTRSAELLGEQFANHATLAADVEAIMLRVTDVRKQFEKFLEKRRLQEASGSVGDLVARAADVNGVRVVAAEFPSASIDELKSAGDTLRTKIGSGVGVLAAVIDDKVQLVCVVTDDLITGKGLKAGVIVAAAAKLVGGGGGGRPHLATAGGKDVAKVTEAIAKIPDIVRSLL